MREAEERFRRSFEDSPTGMALVDARGEASGRILEVNEALVDLTGLSREELVGSDSLQELTHRDDVEFVREGLARLVRGEVPVTRIEFRLRGLAGQVRWVDLTASIVRGEEGEPLYRISQLQDIDARRARRGAAAPPRRPRHAQWAVQPPALPRGARARAAGRRARRGAAVRPRQLQGGQRHAGARGGRRGDPARRPRAERAAAHAATSPLASAATSSA
jgi:PAS domain S-box-containing protein